MRILLLYDLPTIEETDRKEYNSFHKSLKKIGFYMLQYSVYIKTIQNETNFNQIITKINNKLPKKGQIVILKITEKQYQDMSYLKGEQNKFDSIVGGNEIVYFGGE